MFPKALYCLSCTLLLSISVISSLSPDHHLYADDTQLSFHPLNFDSSVSHLQNALQQISFWMTANSSRLNSCSSNSKTNFWKYTTLHLTPPTLLDHFSQSYRDRFKSLKDDYNSLRINYYGILCSIYDLNFDVDFINHLILDLKRGKAADSLTAEHLLPSYCATNSNQTIYRQRTLCRYIANGFKHRTHF